MEFYSEKTLQWLNPALLQSSTSHLLLQLTPRFVYSNALYKTESDSNNSSPVYWRWLCLWRWNVRKKSLLRLPDSWYMPVQTTLLLSPHQFLLIERRTAEVIMHTVMAVSLCLNGRTPADWKDYLGPNDEQEMDRLDMMHKMMLTMTGRKLFLAPIGESPRRALDLGTGTGIWAIEFGEDTIEWISCL